MTFATTTGDRTRGQWKVYLGSHLTMRNLVVKGANPVGGTGDSAYVAELEAQHGLEFAGTAGVELDHVTVTDVYGDFIYLGAFIGATNTWTTDVSIHDSRFERNGRQGLAFTAARNVDIYHNYIGNTRRATLDFEPNGAGWGVSNVTFRDNTVGPGRLNFVSAVGAGPMDGLSITNNSFVGRAMQMTWWAPTYARRSGLTITGNVADSGFGNNGGAAIGVVDWDRVKIRNNVQWLQSGRNVAFVDAWESCEVDIGGNDWTGGAAEGRIRDFGCPLGSPTTLSGAFTPTSTPTPPTTSTPTPTGTPATAPLPTPSPTTTTRPKQTKSPHKPRTVSAIRAFDVVEPVQKGDWVTLTGRVVTSIAGTGWTNTGRVRVAVQFRTAGGSTYRTVGTVRSRWNGKFRATRLAKATRSGSWRTVVRRTAYVARSVAKPDFVRITRF